MRNHFKIMVLVSACLSIAGLLLARVIDIQVWRGEHFRAQADDNRFFTLPVAPDRGVILDRYGEPLVFNTRRYYRITNPQALHQQKEVVTREQALAEMATGSATIVSQPERLYRFPEALSHILGYVGAVTAGDLERDSHLKVSDMIGKLGLEAVLDEKLRGASGKEQFEINALGQRQKRVAFQPAQPGQNIETTLDPYLNQIAYQALGNNTGVVAMINAENGEVLALVSNPTFNPNILTKTAASPDEEKTRQQQVRSLFSDPRQLLFNRAISGQYPPGSIFKLVTSLAALEEGKVDQSTTVVDEGVLTVGEYQYGNWYYRQYGGKEGSLNIVRALARSNDIFFYKAAEWIGPDQLALMARVFGFGQATGVGITPEAKGLVPDPQWKESVLGERWFLGNTYHYGIGQGDVLVSPMQIAQLIQAVGNHGTLCQPTLLKTGKQNCRELGLKDENVNLVLSGMLDACSSGGTGFPFFAYNGERRGGANPQEDMDKGAVACKTGTAEFGGVMNEQGHRKTHGWFVAVKEFNQDQLVNGALSDSLVAQLATASAALQSQPSNPLELRQKWVENIKPKGFPQKVAFVSMVESSEDQPFKEGSRDAGPVIKQIIDWMEGR